MSSGAPAGSETKSPTGAYAYAAPKLDENTAMTYASPSLPSFVTPHSMKPCVCPAGGGAGGCSARGGVQARECPGAAYPRPPCATPQVMHPVRGGHRLGSVVLNRDAPTRFRTPDLHNVDPKKDWTNLSTHSAGLEPSPTASEGSSVSSSVSIVHSGQGQLPPSGHVPDTAALHEDCPAPPNTLQSHPRS